MAHTRGPWKVGNEGPALLTIEATDGREECVLAEIETDGSREDADNARLMAEAPALVLALKLLLKQGSFPAAAEKQARAAIKKAGVA
jgi:hypothetical protein